MSALGKSSDGDLAHKFGLSRRYVCGLRLKQGIQAFAGFLLTQEGKPCRSILEARFDAWLHFSKIEHLHQCTVPGTRYIADYLIDGVYHEIVGMCGYARYDEVLRVKKQKYRQLAIPVVYITKEQVDWICADCPVSVRVAEHRICSTCGIHWHDLPNGLCRKCNRKEWGTQNASDAVCDECQLPFKKKAGGNNRFCSLECYYSSLRLDLPSAQELVEISKTRSINGLAKEIGVRAGTLYQRIRRFEDKKVLA